MPDVAKDQFTADVAPKTGLVQSADLLRTAASFQRVCPFSLVQL